LAPLQEEEKVGSNQVEDVGGEIIPVHVEVQEPENKGIAYQCNQGSSEGQQTQNQSLLVTDWRRDWSLHYVPLSSLVVPMDLA
jgi:hypothetical protein